MILPDCDWELIFVVGLWTVWKKRNKWEYEHKRIQVTRGVIRDESAKWLLGFAVKLGNMEITTAEVIGLRDGLSFAWERHYEKLEILNVIEKWW